MTKVAVDFASGLHGRFLEYVINRYIFCIPTQVDNIFTSSGSCHMLDIDLEYKKYSRVAQGHYSANGFDYPADTEKIIFIKHDPKFNFVLLTNVFYRCYPINKKNPNGGELDQDMIKQYQLDLLSSSGNTQNLRRNWYTKLIEDHFNPTKKNPSTELPTFYFDYGSFFNLDQFLLELKKLSNFIGYTFKFDISLSLLWQEFIERNQGHNAYTKVHRLMDAIYFNQSVDIDLDWQAQAYMNTIISQKFDIYNGVLFDYDSYPANTQQIAKIIADHVETFDQRF